MARSKPPFFSVSWGRRSGTWAGASRGRRRRPRGLRGTAAARRRRLPPRRCGRARRWRRRATNGATGPAPRAAWHEPLAGGNRGCLHAIGWHNGVYQPSLARALGTERFTQHEELEGARIPHAHRRKQARTGLGQQPELEERRAKARLRRCVDEVTVEQHRSSDADRQTVHRGNERLSYLRQLTDEVEDGARQSGVPLRAPGIRRCRSPRRTRRPTR